MTGEDWQAGSKNSLATAGFCLVAGAVPVPALAASGGFQPASYIGSLDPHTIWEALIGGIVIASFLGAAVFLGFTGACLAPRPESTTSKPDPKAKASADPHVVFYLHYTGFGKRPIGLLVAAWDDGVIVFASNPDEPGKDLQTGTITTDQLKHTLDEIKGAGFFDEQ